MKKILVILSILVVAQSCLGVGNITISPDLDGDLGTSSNPLSVGDVIDVYIVVDSDFISIDVLVTIAGNIEFVTASGLSDSVANKTNDASAFGWNTNEDPTYGYSSYDPFWAADGSTVEMGLSVGLGQPKSAGNAALVQLQVMGEGELTLTINQGTSFSDISTIYDDGTFSGAELGEFSDSVTLYSVPEPATVMILVLGMIPAITKRKK